MASTRSASAAAGELPSSSTAPRSPSPQRPRSGSVASISTSPQAQAQAQVDKEQLAQTLDKIHNSASQSDALTTFKDFAEPSVPIPPVETKTIPGELVQQGLSGLYSRLKEVVGVVGHPKPQPQPPPEDEEEEIPSLGAKRRSSNTGHTASKSSVSSIPRTDTVSAIPLVQSSQPSEMQVSAIASPTPQISTLAAAADGQHPTQSSKVSATGLVTGLVPSIRSHSSGRQSLPAMSRPAGTVAEPTTTTVTAAAHREGSRMAVRAESVSGRSSSRKSSGKADPYTLGSPPSESPLIFDSRDLKTLTGSSRTRKESMMTLDGSIDGGVPVSPVKSPTSPTSHHHRTTSTGSTSLASKILRVGSSRRDDSRPMSSASGPKSPTYPPSQISSLDASAGRINSGGPPQLGLRSPVLKFPFSLAATEQVNAKLERMKRQVLSKEYWMKDETCRECFQCGAPFTAWRRKHHCRTCGCIFDSKCTSIISGQAFGASGSIRVCKPCLDIINRRSGFEASGSDDDSADDSYVPTTFYRGSLLSNQQQQQQQQQQQSQQSQHLQSFQHRIILRTASPVRGESSEAGSGADVEDARSATTPMMAIPTRRVGDSAALEIDAPHLSRPSSSRSLKSLATGRPQSSGHKRHRSKHDLLGWYKASADARAPFRHRIDEELARKQKLPAFHDDSIIDPDLAPFMSDESSGDEQMSIFATLASNNNTNNTNTNTNNINIHNNNNSNHNHNHTSNSNDMASGNLEQHDKGTSSLGTYVGTAKKNRGHRQGEKSVSGLSFTTRGGFDDASTISPMASHQRTTRRRNLSNVGGSVHHLHLRSPRPKSGIFSKGPATSNETLSMAINTASVTDSTMMTRSDSLRHKGGASVGAGIELPPASLQHARKLLLQLLQDSDIPHPSAWEKALMPILLKCTDDVEPNIRAGDFMDIRKYVKLKKIPGGRPGDTSYVSGIIFTKKLALKSMPRKIIRPKIVALSFPIEYQRQQQQFMSLKLVIEQEKEFLRIVVNRIISLEPQVVLTTKGIAGVALQYLADAGIAVAYNVNPNVIDAVVRCTQTRVISSLDMLSLDLEPGRCEGFDVKTFVNNDFPGRKKSYILLSGCPKDRGCTIVLRGAPTATLKRMKVITEFMIYAVYNMKLESCLLRDLNVRLPSPEEMAARPKPKHQANSQTTPGLLPEGRSKSGSTASLPGNAHSYSSHPPSANASASQSQAEVGAVPSLQASAVMMAQATGDEGGPSEDATAASIVVGDHPVEPGPQPVPAEEEEPATAPEAQVPEDVPMPTYYSDMVAKYKTKILSASPFVKFTQPYLLMKAREQERRLVYLKRLRDQDVIQRLGGAKADETKPQKFQLIDSAMVNTMGQEAPPQMMEILGAVHDAEYHKAMQNYKVQTRHWETYIDGNIDLFDPYSHQNIVVLYSVTCTETKIPCVEPSLAVYGFYDEQEDDLDPDIPLGQFIELQCDDKDVICSIAGCPKRLADHHRTFVHDQARVTIFIEDAPPGPSPQEKPGLDGKAPQDQDAITMWSYCKICKRDTPASPMSPNTWKYSLGKYLELLFWSKGLRLDDGGDCPHDHTRDHIHYFGFRDGRIRIHYDPIDLLEIVGPRTRVTWKVENDLKLKNDTFKLLRDRWCRFIASLQNRLKSISIDSVVPEKAADCKADLEGLAKKAQNDQTWMVQKLQNTYVKSKYYEVVPFNAIVREMVIKIDEWDQAFNKFESDFLGEKDLKQLTMIQLRKIFSDDESKESLPTDTTPSIADADEKVSQAAAEDDENGTRQSLDATEGGGGETGPSSPPGDDGQAAPFAAGETIDAERAGPGDQGDRGEEGGGLQRAHRPAALTLEKTVAPETMVSPERPRAPRLRSPDYHAARSHPDGTEVAVGPLNTEEPVSPQTRGPVDTSLPCSPPATSETDNPMRLAERVGSLSRGGFPPSQSAGGLHSTADQGGQGSGQGSGQAPRPVPDRTSSRRSTRSAISLTMPRALSRGPTSMARVQSGMGKPVGPKDRLDNNANSANNTNSTNSNIPSATNNNGSETDLSAKSGGDRRFSDRIVSALKTHRKGGQSAIPRPVKTKKESRVSALASQFEKLSAELHKEALGPRKRRATMFSRQSRTTLPRTSNKAIVEVYDDLNEAVQETGPSDLDPIAGGRDSLGKLAEPPKTPAAPAPPAPAEPPSRAEPAGADTAAEVGDGPPTAVTASQITNESGSRRVESEEASVVMASQAVSDDEAGASDAEPSTLEDLDLMPDVKEIADSLQPHGEMPPELPKHQKLTIVKLLQSFWSERSPSSWPALEYPVQESDHIFMDSDLIVREDEPTSLIAFALSSEDYKDKLWSIRDSIKPAQAEAGVEETMPVQPQGESPSQGQSQAQAQAPTDGDEAESGVATAVGADGVAADAADAPAAVAAVVDATTTDDTGGPVTPDAPAPDVAPASGGDNDQGGADDGFDGADAWAAPAGSSVERSLTRSTCTHFKYGFRDGPATMVCKIFYVEQFDALRRKCGVADRFIESLSRCVKWDSKGGKTKSTFLKTLDDRWVCKSLSPIETSAFLRFAPAYFSLMAAVLFRDLPSVIAKMMGFFQIVIKNPTMNTEVKLDLLVMENLFYDRAPSRIFDLKGSMRNRKVQSTGEQNEVLLDENMVEYIYESPLFAFEHSKKLLRASVWNDTLFLAQQNVMDYSLMVAVDEPRKELVIGIIDCIRTYTWDKKLESWIKDRGFAGGGRNRPTVTSPKEYKTRFREAMARYILQAPNCWHQFGAATQAQAHAQGTTTRTLKFEQPGPDGAAG